jgi:hypothetical protein
MLIRAIRGSGVEGSDATMAGPAGCGFGSVESQHKAPTPKRAATTRVGRNGSVAPAVEAPVKLSVSGHNRFNAAISPDLRDRFRRVG